ncbi:MAG: hypothetical protein ACK5MZ_08390 [Aestuariibaculum sp.]
MHNKTIQIITFDNPFPPNYGGTIDQFYKIKALHAIGVIVYLHVFYTERNDFSGLEPYCKKIYKYKRDTSFFKHLSILPFAVVTRKSNVLIENLNKTNAPVLFESLRCTYLLKYHNFKQKTAVRCHNIEHDYSWGLFKSEPNWLKKGAYYIEGIKFKIYESVLKKADALFTISHYETDYFKNIYGEKTAFLPVFQESEEVQSTNGFGKYALYHGDLLISDNIKSAFFLIDVFKDLNKPLIIASSNHTAELLKKIDKYPNITFEKIKDEFHLDNLIKNAHINTLYSFQQSGTKLKVFNALFKGRYCMVNKNMVDDANVLQLCELAETKQEYQNAVEVLFTKEFKVTKKHYDILEKYNVIHNARNLIDFMYS